ncbi:MerR family transcriptional regulator [Secundilactobacillus muriivasis]
MDYQIQAFAALTGVTARTLRYYHQIGLLVPQVDDSGYRHYSSADASRLQLIRFYQAVGFPLKAIKPLLDSDVQERLTALKAQRSALYQQQQHLTTLIAQVDSTIATQEGKVMTDSEKFAAFKADMMQQNKEQYGDEVRTKWGAAAQQQANQHVLGLDETTYQRAQTTEQRLIDTLTIMTQTGDDLSEQVYQQHREWLEVMAGELYSSAYHRGLADMYEADARFAAYYNERVGSQEATPTLVAAIRRWAVN